MKKNYLLLLLLAVSFVNAQVNYDNVINLLLSNKRNEARTLFDKQFAKTKTSNIDLLFIDAILDEESGRIDFDEELIKNLEKLPNSEYYIAPFINRSFVLSDVKDGMFNDLTYKKIDFLASSPKFRDLPIVKYRKAIFERIRHLNNQSKKSFEDLGAIKNWQFCGVFENLNGSGLDVDYEPEIYAKNDKLFDANSNGNVGWYNPKNSQNEAYHFFGNESEYGAGIIYAQTFINANEAKHYLLSFGSNKGLKIFLNDKEVYYNQDIKRTNLDAYTIKIPLEKGFNRLLFKIELSNDNDYFSATIKDLQGKTASDLSFSNTYKPYYVATKDYNDIEEIPLDFERYFDDLVKKNPDNILYRIYQFSAYEANYKKLKAYESLEGLNEKYPKSSLINNYFIKYYNILGDESQKIDEISKNLETNDPEYYLNSLSKLLDSEWLKTTQISELERYRDVSKKYKQRYVELMFDFMIKSRQGNINEMIPQLEQLVKDSYNNEKILIIATNLSYKLKNNSEKTIATFENILKEKDIYEVTNTLLSHYKSLNRKEDVEKIMKGLINKYPHLNDFRTNYVNYLLQDNKYDEALKLLNENLEYFPYSFVTLENKALIFSLQKNEKEAANYIRKSLEHNSGNSNLRKKLYDITKTPDEIEQVATKGVYDLVKKRRNSNLKTDYGVVTLLDEYIVNVLPEGGRKEKVTFLYEIVNESGIDNLKEYSLSSDYSILKSEIIKKDGSLAPAEKGDNTLVFSNLQIGDVVYISYENFDNRYGRFYRDFNISCYFNNSYPSVETIFGIIHSPDLKYQTAFANGDVPSTTSKLNGKTVTIWKKTNIPGIPNEESYSPIFSDITNNIKIGTIKSWKDISNWYADLVKKNIKADKVTINTFKQIFPKGLDGLSQQEKAYRIYKYIETNINYSSLDFRQSGYVPQKPSKTIQTKLGDCKDVSTLFVVLSELAGLKSNLVLVLTNDNGLKGMKLPSIDFNHCIVKTNIDGKDVFVELTDKYLPFRALPLSLYKANALVVSFDKAENEKAQIINIPFDNALTNVSKTYSEVTINDKGKSFVNKHIIQGSGKSYYNELFSNATTEDVRKKELESNFNSRLKKVISLESVKLLSNEVFDNELTYESKFFILENIQKVGSLKITSIPFIDNAYTRDIIATETRTFDINYISYENNNQYDSEVILKIPADKTFSEIPQDKILNFKNHNYSIAYQLVDKQTLKVKRKVNLSWDNISTVEYQNYKKFVESVIEVEEQVVGFR